jgi:hypothetical protein
MVDANSSRATAVASGTPTSTKITWRPLSSSVSGPNIGWTEVTRPPAAASARRPSRSGLFSEPTSNTTPGGGAAPARAGSRRSPASARDDDQLVIERERAPVGDPREALDLAGRIGDLDREALGREKRANHLPHAPGAADHQRAPTATAAGLRHGRAPAR